MNGTAQAPVVVLVAGIVDPKWSVAADAALAEPSGKPAGQRKLSPFDEAALEVALQLRDADPDLGFVALVLSEPGDESLLQAVAAFTPRSTVAFAVPRVDRLDARSFADRVAALVARHAPDPGLILVGREFGDLDDGAMPVMLAAALGADFVALAQAVVGDGAGWRAVRPMGDGEARVAVAGHAVISVTNSQRNRLRHPIVRNVMAARRMRFAIEAVEAVEAIEAVRSASPVGVERVEPVSVNDARDRRDHRVLDGSLAEQALMAARAIQGWTGRDGASEGIARSLAGGRCAPMQGPLRMWALLAAGDRRTDLERRRFLCAVARAAESAGTGFGAIVTGCDPDAAAHDAAVTGAQRVIAATHAALDAHADPRAHARVAVTALERAGVELAGNAVVLVPFDARAEELGHWFAALSSLSPCGRSTRLSIDAAAVSVDRAIYGGRLSVTLRLARGCVMACRPAPALPAVLDDPVTIESLSIDVPIERRAIEAIEDDPLQRARLEGAAAVVAGGRGIGNAEGFEALARLAEQLGGAVGGSLPAVDAGWAPVSHQIGQSGKYVAPGVYIAVGISGTLQHMAGIAPETRIVAINQDRDAAIFAAADIGIVGDWREVVPALTQALSTTRSSA